MSSKTKNILIVILSTITVLLIGIVIYLVMLSKDRTSDIIGKVIVVGSDYVIIENSDDDYLVQNIDQNYDVGDEIKVTYKEREFNDETSPKTIISKDSILIKKDSSQESIDTTANSNEPSTTQKTTTKKPITTTTKKIDPTDADDEVVEYIEELKKDFDATTIKDSAKKGFITVIDFIFYNGSIKGHTFKELSASAKLKVLSTALYFDGKIENYFPGYKESISSTTNKIYTNIKNEIVETYLNVAAKVCEKNGEACETAKKEFATIKKNLGLTWSLIKDIAGDGLDKLKSWYEIFSGK